MEEGLTISFTKGQTLQGVIMDAGWKVAEFSEIEATVSSTGKDGYTVKFTILSPKKYEGVIVPSWHYDDIGLGNLHKVFEAIVGHKIDSEKQYNAQALLKKPLKIHTSQGTYNDRPTNNINEFTTMNNERATVRE